MFKNAHYSISNSIQGQAYNIITNYTETENHRFRQRERTPLQARFKIGWVAVSAQFLLTYLKKN